MYNFWKESERKNSPNINTQYNSRLFYIRAVTSRSNSHIWGNIYKYHCYFSNEKTILY